MTTIKEIKRFFTRPARLGLMAAAGLMASGARAAGFDDLTLVTNDWFDASFTGLTVDTVISQGDTTGITSGTGSWTAVPTTGTAKIAADADQGGEATLLSINAEDEELTFTPAALATATGMATVTVDMKTIAVDTLPTPEGDAQGAFAIYSPDGEAHSLAAYVSDGTTGVWTNLVYASAADLTNDWFTLTLDFATVSNVRYVRYSITPPAGSLTILEDTEGTQWFQSASNATTVASVSFTGTGNIRTFSGDSLAEPVATCNGENYATVADAIEAAEENGTVTLVKAVTEDVLTISENITLDFNGKAASLGGIVINEGKTLTVTKANASGNVIPTITGGGNLVVSGSNTFNWKGMAGTSTLASITQEGTSGGISIFGNGTINVTGAVMVGATLTFTPDAATSDIISAHPYYTIKLAAASVTAATLNGGATIETTSGVTASAGTFYGTIAGTGGLTANGDFTMQGPSTYSGTLSIAAGKTMTLGNILNGLTYRWRLVSDCSDTYTLNENDAIQKFQSGVSGKEFSFKGTEGNQATFVENTSYFGGKKVALFTYGTGGYSFGERYYQSKSSIFVLQKNSDASSSGDYLQRYVSGGNIDYLYINSDGEWVLNKNSTKTNTKWPIYQDGAHTNTGFEKSRKSVLSIVTEIVSGQNRQDGIGYSFDGAIAEAWGFASTISLEQRAAAEAYLMWKWDTYGKSNSPFLPATADVSIAAGATLDLGGLTQTVKSISVSSDGTTTVRNGTLTVTDAISVSAGKTLVIPYGSSYALANDGTFAVEDSVGGTVTITHRAADIEGTPYDTVQGAIDAYESGTLTIHESATIDLGTTDVNIRGIVLDDGVELTLTQNAPWTTTFSEGNLVNTRVASTYTWTPTGSSTDWNTLSNWRIGTATPVVAAGNSDTVVFPALEEETEAHKITVTSANVASVIINGDVEITGAIQYTRNSSSGNSIIYTTSVTGTGKATLGNNAGFGSSTKGSSLSIDVPLVVTASKDTPAAIQGYWKRKGGLEDCSSATITGAITGTGYICFSGNRFSCSVTGSVADFEGTIEITGDSLERNSTTFADVSSKAKYNITNNSSDDNSFITNYAADLSFRELSGSPTSTKIHGDTTYTWEVGSGNTSFTLNGKYHKTGDANSYNDKLLDGGIVIKKVGTGIMDFGGTWIHGLEIAAGTVHLRSSSMLTQNTKNYTYTTPISFTGGILQVGYTTVNHDTEYEEDGETVKTEAYTEYVPFDPSANILNSTSQIVFDDQGTNCTWATALDSSNTGGFTKKGAGTLTLSAAPLYTGATTVEEGSLIVNDATFSYTLGKNTAAEVDSENNKITFYNSAAVAKTAIEAAEDGGSVDIPATVSDIGDVTLADGATVNLKLVPGNSLTVGTISGGTLVAKVVGNVGGSPYDMTSYYTSASLTVAGDTTISPQLADSVKAELNSEATEGVEPVAYTSAIPTFKLKNSVKKGLYYGVGTVSNPASTVVTVLAEQQATADGQAISLTPASLDFSGGNVIYYKLSVSDTAQINTP